MSDDRDLHPTGDRRGRLPGRCRRSGEPSTIVALPAEIDISNAERVRLDLGQAVDLGFRVIIADMSRTSFCDCAGVSALLAAAGQAARTGAELRVVARAGAVLRTFELTGVQLALPVFPTSSDALRATGTWTGPRAVGRVVRLLSRRQRADRAGSVPLQDQPRCP
jgi:anti-sigma B factor antagonist